MHRTLSLTPFIGSYSFCLLLGCVAAFVLARFSARRAGIQGRHIDNLALLLVCIGLAGARVFSWIFYFPPGIGFWKGVTQPGAGLVFYGGVVFGMATVWCYSRWTKIPVLALMDLFAAPLALGLAFGRIGCFLAGCCWGDLCVDAKDLSGLSGGVRYQTQTLPIISGKDFPLAVRFPSDSGALHQHQELGWLPAGAAESLPVHPVQLYEAALALVLTVWLVRVFRRRVWTGQVFCAFGFGYGLIRFSLEFLRADNSPVYFGLTLSQVISILAVMASALLLIRRNEISAHLRPGAQSNNPLPARVHELP